MKKKMRANTKTFAMIGGVALFLFAFYCYKRYIATPGSDEMILLAAAQLNKTCPTMVDASTRLDGAEALISDKLFEYDYTIINMERRQIDTSFVRGKLSPGIIDNVCKNPDMKLFRDSKYTLAYHYVDRKGEYIMTIFVTPAEYEANKE